MTCQHERRERHAGRATSTFCQRMNRKGNIEREDGAAGEGGSEGGHYEQRRKAGGGHELAGLLRKKNMENT